jgi:hypothetical protein
MATMDSRVVLGVVLLGACKAELGAGPTDAGDSSGDDSGNTVQTIDAATDGPAMLGPWGAPQAIPGASSNLGEDDCTLSSNKLELYFKRNDSNGPNLYVMTRASESSAWGTPVALTALNTGDDEESPRLTNDDLTLYFGREGDIYRTTRAAIGQPWGAPTPVATLNTSAYEKWAAVCSNGYVIVSRFVTGSGQQLFEGNVATGAPTALTQLNSPDTEQGTFLTADCLRVYFQSDRDNDQFNIYTASRVTMSSAWSNPTAIPDFNTATFDEEDAWISADQRTFVFASNRNGNKDVFISTR